MASLAMPSSPGGTAAAEVAGAASSGGGFEKTKGTKTMSEKKTGIVERVKQASTPQEIAQLAEEIKGFSFVSAQTLGRFHRALKRRQQELRDAS
jgi:hypothetical protein